MSGTAGLHHCRDAACRVCIHIGLRSYGGSLSQLCLITFEEPVHPSGLTATSPVPGEESTQPPNHSPPRTGGVPAGGGGVKKNEQAPTEALSTRSSSTLPLEQGEYPQGEGVKKNEQAPIEALSTQSSSTLPLEQGEYPQGEGVKKNEQAPIEALSTQSSSTLPLEQGEYPQGEGVKNTHRGTGGAERGGVRRTQHLSLYQKRMTLSSHALLVFIAKYGFAINMEPLRGLLI